MQINSANTPLDLDARRRAVDPTGSFVVSAPAGSGKTGLLTLRVLNLLAVVNKPEEILCITFTRKAAQEMRERIFSSLLKAEETLQCNRDLSQMDAYERELIEAAIAALKNNNQKSWNLLQTQSRLTISTIDGFCKTLCNQLPISSGLGSNSGLVDTPTIEYAACVKAWLDDALSKDSPALTKLMQHLGGDLDRLSELLTKLLAVRDQWLPLIYQGLIHQNEQSISILKKQFEDTLQAWIEHAIDKVQIYFQPYETELFELFRYIKSNLEQEQPALEALFQTDAFILNGTKAAAFWRAMAELFLTKAKDASFRKKVDKRLGFPAGTNKKEKIAAKAKKELFFEIVSAIAESGLDIEQLAELRNLPEPEYQHKQWAALDALFHILPHLSAYLRLRFIEISSTDFVELSLAAVNALNADSGNLDLLQRLDYRIQHILIDEFQDTSQIQLELLQALTAEWRDGDGRSLFLVGDGMQSCYAFRNAKVGIFLNMRQHGLANISSQALDLNLNFRSTQTIIHWINKHFSPAFPADNDADYGAVAYTPSHAFKASTNDSYVRCLSFEYSQSEEHDAEQAADQEADFICEEISRLKAENDQKSIAILVKSRSHVRTLIKKLAEHKIDYQAVEIDALASRQYVRDIYCLAQIFTQPTEKLYWLACLRSPFCGLSHADLWHIFRRDTDARKTMSAMELIVLALEESELSSDGRARLLRFFKTYKHYASFLGRRSLAEQIELAWMELGGPEQVQDSAELDDINRFLALMSECTRYGQLDWESFDNKLEKLFANPVTKTASPVQIMTMHKSKGLEFDTVFLPQLHKSPPGESTELLYWLERADLGSPQFILSPMTARNEKEKDGLTQFISAQQKRKLELEQTRLFYVACTRAKARLYLSAVFKRDPDSGELKAPGKQSLLHKIWPTVAEQFTTPATREKFQRALKAATEKPSIKAMPLSWQSSIKKLNRNLQQPEIEGQSLDNAGLDIYNEFEPSSVSAEAGTLFHKILQNLVESQLVPSHFNAGKAKANYRNLLRQKGFTEADQAHYAQAFSDCVSKLLQNETAGWLLNHRHRASACELELAEVCQGRARHHVIDRTFIDGDTRWVIDYKTSEPRQEQAWQEFEQAQIKEYSPQLARYRDLLMQLDQDLDDAQRPVKIRTALYFPFAQRLSIVPELERCYADLNPS